MRSGWGKLSETDGFFPKFLVYALASDIHMPVILQPFLETMDFSGFNLKEERAMGSEEIKRNENHGERNTNVVKFCFTLQIQW